MRLLLMGLVAALGVVALGDLHRHRCPGCATSWWHFGRVALGDENAHRCPGCGRGPQWERA